MSTIVEVGGGAVPAATVVLDELPHATISEISGIPGTPGATGPQGPQGEGVMSGGTLDQVLAKASGTDYDTKWSDINQAVPAGGDTDQVLAKASATDFDLEWVEPTEGNIYNHNQAAPSSTWTVNHNLGYRPSVSVFDPGGSPLWAEIDHVTVNQTLIKHAIAYTGDAYFS